MQVKEDVEMSIKKEEAFYERRRQNLQAAYNEGKLDALDEFYEFMATLYRRISESTYLPQTSSMGIMEDGVESPHPSEELRAKTLLWLEAWNANHPELLKEVFAADILCQMPPFPDLNGIEAQAKLITDLHQAFPDLHIMLDELIILENTVVERWTWKATHTGQSTYFPIPPTNKPVEMIGSTISHWSNGVVVEAWQLGDWMGLLQQVGSFPPMDIIRG
jgi:predicted ester cyclase